MAETVRSAPVGRFVWYDLMTTDMEGAERFYTSLFGWKTQDFEGAPGVYRMWSNGDDVIGGFMELKPEQREAGVPPNWTGSIAVANVDEAARRAQQLGGAVHVPPMDIPGVGRYAVLMDPQGAAFAIFSANEYWPGTDGQPPIGAVSWHELGTSDWANAWAFYRELFGWEDATAMDMGPELGMYQMFGRNGIPAGAVYTRPASEGPPAWLYYTRVGDADQAAKRVTELGGQVLVGPMDVPGGDRVAVCLDPQGAAFAVHSTGQA